MGRAFEVDARGGLRLGTERRQGGGAHGKKRASIRVHDKPPQLMVNFVPTRWVRARR